MICQGSDCHCLASVGEGGSPGLPLSQLSPSQCDQPCPGQPGQRCGGAQAVTVVTAQCEQGWTRLGSKCLYQRDLLQEAGEQEVTFHQAASFCSITMGGNLFWPSSMEELTFVKDTFW